MSKACGQVARYYTRGVCQQPNPLQLQSKLCANLLAFGNSDDMTIWFKLKANQKANETTYQLNCS
jgi:hypothetical protein